MRFTQSFLDEIRDRVPISSVIGPRVAWDRKKSHAQKGDWWACCPFHGEKSPSFHCEDRKGRYHCFGCGVSGDHFRFMTEHDGMSFPEAVEKLAEMAGVPMPDRDAEAEKRDERRTTLQDVMDMAAAFFQERLQSADGAKARAYLRDRGLTSATQQGFRLGYAPDSRNALKEHLAGKGVGREQIEACGLVVHGDDIPVSYDRFRDRIMFPIPDSRGRIIAFGGRAMAKDAPAKYLNSPETEIFRKGEVLFNFARARPAVREAGTVIAVEGYMDVIALAQAGFAHVVAPLGTALTERQLELLWRMAGEPVLCFDGDQAGLKAAYRAAELMLPSVEPGRSARFVLLPGGKDPDDLVKAEGPEAFRAVVKDARPLADMLWMRETAGGVFDTPERRAELEKRLRDLTQTIRDETTRRHYAQDMRDRVHAFFGRPTGERRPNDKRGDARPGAPSGRLAVSDRLARSAMVKGAGGDMPLRESTLLVTLVNHPRLAEEHFDEIEALDIRHSGLKALHRALIDAIAHREAGDVETLREALARAGALTAYETAEARVRAAYQWPSLANAALEDAREAFQQSLQLLNQSRALERELKTAEIAFATESTDENFRHLVDVQRQWRDAQSMEALIEGFGGASGRGRAR
ncbi:MAG: DNA primase [Phyllobacteriaceae bacterium]|nr:DNA primase [Phyllobacteriaceae bacterium]